MGYTNGIYCDRKLEITTKCGCKREYEIVSTFASVQSVVTGIASTNCPICGSEKWIDLNENYFKYNYSTKINGYFHK